jgi:predicted GNAT family N-acyltransferase
MSSQNDISSNNLEVKILERSDDLSTFDCGKDDVMGLNEFIHFEAHQFQKENLGVTHLFLYNKQIVGFATLAMSQIEIKLAQYILPIKVKIKYYPALEIGRLAIHNDYRGRHVGRCVCLWCLSLAKRLSKDVGCRLIVVLTEGKPVEFYKKCGFEVVPKYENKQRKWLFLQVPQE